MQLQVSLQHNIRSIIIIAKEKKKIDLIIFGDIDKLVLTPAIQSVMLGGGSLGLARPKSLFILVN